MLQDGVYMNKKLCIAFLMAVWIMTGLTAGNVSAYVKKTVSLDLSEADDSMADVNEAEVRGFFEYKFRSDLRQMNLPAVCYYSDYFFRIRNSTYNHRLAKMSLALALSAFQTWGSEGIHHVVDASVYQYGDPIHDLRNTPAENVVELLHDCGFQEITVNQDFLLTTQYDLPYNDGNNIGICLANKTLKNGDVLIAAAIRGGGYGDEWIGNLNCYGSGLEHKGFLLAAEKVLNEIKAYILAENLEEKKLKIWITGYSRAGAAADLAAAIICREGIGKTKVGSKDVYAYTFEAPRVTKNRSCGDEMYQGIYNIINPLDLVTYVPMKGKGWGYKRYGKDKYLPCRYTDYLSYCFYERRVLKEYCRYTGGKTLSLPQVTDQLKTVIDITDQLALILKNDHSEILLRLYEELRDMMIADRGIGMDGSELLAFVLDKYKKEMVFLFSVMLRRPVRNFAGAVISYSFLENYAEKLSSVHLPELELAWMNQIPGYILSDSWRYGMYHS